MGQPLVDGAEEALATQLRAVQRLTVAVHESETAADFYDEAINTVLSVVDTDRASLLLFDPDGVLRFKAWRGLSEGYRRATEGHTPWVRGDLTARAILVPDVEADPDLAELLPVLRSEGIAAAAFVPLICRDGLVGKFMLYYAAAHAFSAAEVAMAEVLAGHVALAVERHRDRETLRSSAARLASLQKVTAELSRAVGTDDVAAVALGLALDELGATSGSLCLIEGDELRIAAAAGYAADVMSHWGRFGLDADLPASEAVRTGRAVFLRSDAERRERYPLFVSTPLVQDEAYAILPLGAEIPMGALVAGFPESRTFSEEDQSYLLTLAGQCAAALGRATLYEQRESALLAAEASRERLAFLAQASASLASSLDYNDTLARLADLAVPRLADWCAVYLLEGGRPGLAGLAHAEPHLTEAAQAMLARYPIELESPIGIGAVLRTGVRQINRPLTAQLREQIARDPEHAAQFAELQMDAAAILPILARGRVLGALFLAVHPGRDLDEDTVQLGEELALRAGSAIENARLFTARTAAARTLQASLLPPALPTLPGLDLGARHVSGSAGLDIGGDFYDVVPLHGNRYLLVLGDVRGRGVEAATTALLIRHVIRSAAVQLATPGAILTHLNDVLLQGESEETEPRFATAVVAIVHPHADATAGLTLAVAGHPLPLLRTSDGTLGPVASPGTAVGITDAFTVRDHDLTLRAGDTLLFFTDGATERRNGSQFFGEDGLASSLASATGDAETIAATLQDAVAAFGEDDLGDDLALLVVQIAATRATDHRGPTSGTESLHLRRDPTSAAAARRFLSSRLRDRCSADLVDVAMLLTSELVTNAVRYGSDPIELTLVFGDPASLRISVSDGNPDFPPRLRSSLPTDAGGRGLQLVEALSDSWGQTQHDDRKDVWFVLR